MRQTLVDDYLEEISTELPEELYGNLSDAIYETVCEFDEEVAQLKADNAKLRELVKKMFGRVNYECRCRSVFCFDWDEDNECCVFATSMRELGIEV